MKREKKFVSPGKMPQELVERKMISWLTMENHYIPFLVFVPAVIGLTIYALFFKEVSFLYFGLFFLLAIPLWSIFEYFTHRYVFHSNPKNLFLKKIIYTAHRGHHDYPNDNRFMLVGLTVSLPAIMLFYFLFTFFMGANGIPFLAGWVTGYIVYDWMHFAAHNYNFKNKLFQRYKRHHLRHHFENNELNFGVSTTIWDDAFQTKMEKNRTI